jgi:hypothetical protein
MSVSTCAVTRRRFPVGARPTRRSLWLNVPQAVVLEETRDIELVLDLTAETPALLQIKANWRLARGAVISPEANSHPGAMGPTRLSCRSVMVRKIGETHQDRTPSDDAFRDDVGRNRRENQTSRPKIGTPSGYPFCGDVRVKPRDNTGEDSQGVR